MQVVLLQYLASATALYCAAVIGSKVSQPRSFQLTVLISPSILLVAWIIVGVCRRYLKKQSLLHLPSTLIRSASMPLQTINKRRTADTHGVHVVVARYETCRLEAFLQFQLLPIPRQVIAICHHKCRIGGSRTHPNPVPVHVSQRLDRTSFRTGRSRLQRNVLSVVVFFFGYFCCKWVRRGHGWIHTVAHVWVMLSCRVCDHFCCA